MYQYWTLHEKLAHVSIKKSNAKNTIGCVKYLRDNEIRVGRIWHYCDGSQYLFFTLSSFGSFICYILYVYSFFIWMISNWFDLCFTLDIRIFHLYMASWWKDKGNSLRDTHHRTQVAGRPSHKRGLQHNPCTRVMHSVTSKCPLWRFFFT